MQYYGTRLSENISRREPEGYLLCLNVPVARTGTQEYMPEELGLGTAPIEGAELPYGPVPVYRPEEEVFSPETIASFEGMPVTNDHPPDSVNAGNIRSLQKGHTHNVRRGAGNESDLLLADLIITDPVLIDAILAGKREISCGYTYELCRENGQYIQRKIRGNHVAVVDAGRAGSRVSIKDHIHKPERRNPAMKKLYLKALSRMARDGDPEAVEALAEAVEEIIEAPAAEPETPAASAVQAPAEPAPAAPETGGEPEKEDAGDSDMLSAILEKLDQLIALLTPAAPAADEDDPSAMPEALSEVIEEALQAAEADGEDVPESTVPEEIQALMAEILDPDISAAEESDAEEAENESSACRETADALRTTFRAIRPMMKYVPRRERRQMCVNIARNMDRTGADSAVYAALAKAGARRRAADPAELGKQIMNRRNPNYKQ